MIKINDNNFENGIYVVKRHKGKQWNYKGILVGSNTPLYKFIVLFIKMNLINFSFNKKGTNIDKLLDTV